MSLTKYADEITYSEFYQNYHQSRWWYKKGCFSSGKLFNWADLSNIVSTHEFPDRDLVLAKPGKAYSPLSPARLKSDDENIAHIVGTPSVFSEHIKQGSTLILNRAHKWHPPIARFCADLIAELATDVRTNIYASWKEESAFGAHWDEHDVLVVQLSGKKHWKLYGLADSNPISHRVTKSTNSELEFEVTLEEGDLLYVPKGQVHEVRTGDVPSLHATVGINRLTGIDLFDWLKQVAARQSSFREALPSLKNRELLEEFIADYIRRIQGLLKDGVDMASFEQFSKSKISSRPFVSLPAVGVSKEKKNFSGKKFKINPFITVLGSLDGGDIVLGNGHKKWVAPPFFVEFFEIMVNGMTIEYDSILEKVTTNKSSPEIINSTLADMVDQGVVSLVD